MSENPEQKKGIESGHDVRELKSKQRDQIWARYRRTRNKWNGSNLGAMSENPKKKRKGSHLGAMLEKLNQIEGSNSGTMPENLK